MRRAALLILITLLLLSSPAHGQVIAPGATMPCEWQLATSGGTALACPLGTLRNFTDLEGGTEHWEGGQLDRSKLDLNISSGEAAGVRSRVAINPDVGGPGTVIFDGRRNRIASFYPDAIEFFSPVVFHQGVQVQSTPPVRLGRLTRRVARLERRVVRLRSVLRRVLDGRR